MNGSLIGACNCDWGCPCNFDAPPTYGHCEGMYVWAVDEGRYVLELPLDPPPEQLLAELVAAGAHLISLNPIRAEGFATRPKSSPVASANPIRPTIASNAAMLLDAIVNGAKFP